VYMKEKKDSCQNIVNQLIVQVRNGNQSSFAELLKIYEPLFLSLLSKSNLESLNEQVIEDLRQELTLVFYHSIFSYDLEQNDVRFGLYAKICLRNALITQLRKLQKQKKSLSLEEEDETLFAIFDSGANPSEELVDRETVESMNKKIKGALSPFEVKVWQMYLTGNSTKNISTVLGKSEKSIENAIFRLRRKLRDLFKADF